MTATARLLKQRSVGQVKLRMEAGGVAVLREAGSSKCRIPPGSREAILINTSGGLAGGDSVFIEAAAGANAELVLTTQAAERVYRTLGPAADVKVRLQAAPGATLKWMPHETIVFEQGALTRSLNVELADDATFLAVEPMVFGRHAMGEVVKSVSVHDQWSIKQNGKLVHAENFRLGPEWSSSKATFGSACAMATVLLVSPLAESLIDAVRGVLGPEDGASAWNGKLIARLLARDGFELRKVLLQVLGVVMGRDKLPKTWTF
jgi:urease accessory protein